MTDFFKQLVGLAGYGLVGIAIVMVIVLAYVVLKKPNNKFAILVLTGFCVFVIGLFTYAGVGVTKENKTLSQNFKDTTTHLNDSIKITSAKLNAVSSINTLLTDSTITKDSLTKIAEDIVKNLDTLSNTDKSSSSKYWIDLSNKYKEISTKLQSNEYSTEEAKKVIIENSKKTPIIPVIKRPVTSIIRHN